MTIHLPHIGTGIEFSFRVGRWRIYLVTMTDLFMENVRKSFSCLIYATGSCLVLKKSTFCAFLFSKCSTAGLTDVVRKPVGCLSFLWHPNLRGVDINQWLERFLGCVLILPFKEKGFLS